MSKFYVYYLKVEDEMKPFYVGKSFVGSRRLNEHKCSAKKETTGKARKIQKALREGKRIIEERVATVATEAEAFAIEAALISLFGRRNNKTGFLMNATDGGEGAVGWIVSEETKQKMSEAKKGNKINLGRTRPDVREKWIKPISAFTHFGELVGRYESAVIAGSELEVDYKMISGVLKNKNRLTAPNKMGNRYFQFCYGHEQASMPPVNPKRLDLIPVEQRLPDGTLITIHSNVTKAVENTGIPRYSILIGLRKNTVSAAFRWNYKLQGEHNEISK